MYEASLLSDGRVAIPFDDEKNIGSILMTDSKNGTEKKEKTNGNFKSHSTIGPITDLSQVRDFVILNFLCTKQN